MLKFEIDLTGAEDAIDELAAISSRAQAIEDLHEAMGEAVADLVRQHIAATKESPNTGWWGRVAESVRHTFDASEAVVAVPYPGAALRYRGGTVEQKPGGPLLTIPFDTVPVKNGTRLAAREMGPLAFLPARRPTRKGVVGVLVEGEEYTRTKGPNKGKPATRPKPGGSLLYTLMTETTHRPDPSVLPTDEQISETVRDATLDYLLLR